MLLGVPALFLLVHLISSKGGDGGPVGEQDSWTGEEVEKVVDNHVKAEEEEEEGTGRTDGGSADDGEGSDKGEDDGEEEEEEVHGGDDGSEHEEQEGDGDSEVIEMRVSSKSSTLGERRPGGGGGAPFASLGPKRTTAGRPRSPRRKCDSLKKIVDDKLVDHLWF